MRQVIDVQWNIPDFLVNPLLIDALLLKELTSIYQERLFKCQIHWSYALLDQRAYWSIYVNCRQKDNYFS